MTGAHTICGIERLELTIWPSRSVSGGEEEVVAWGSVEEVVAWGSVEEVVTWGSAEEIGNKGEKEGIEEEEEEEEEEEGIEVEEEEEDEEGETPSILWPNRTGTRWESRSGVGRNFDPQSPTQNSWCDWGWDWDWCEGSPHMRWT